MIYKQAKQEESMNVLILKAWQANQFEISIGTIIKIKRNVVMTVKSLFH